MRILVTGANGLLGQKLVSLLSQRTDITLIASGRGENRNPAGNYEYMMLDLTAPSSVYEKVRFAEPNVIIHTAAMTQLDQCEVERDTCWSQNVTAVEHLCKASTSLDTFFIHLSTDFVFDGTAGPYKEEDEPNPLSYYAKSKLAAEKIVLESGLRYAIARTMLVYGIAHDMSRSNIILWVKKNLEEGKSINVVNDQWRMPTLAEDLARGCLLIAEKQIQGIFHLSGKDMMTPYEMAIETADFFKLDKSLIKQVDASTFSQPAKRPARTGFILDKSIELLGYNPVSFREGIAELARQIAANQPRTL